MILIYEVTWKEGKVSGNGIEYFPIMEIKNTNANLMKINIMEKEICMKKIKY